MRISYQITFFRPCSSFLPISDMQWNVSRFIAPATPQTCLPKRISPILAATLWLSNDFIHIFQTTPSLFQIRSYLAWRSGPKFFSLNSSTKQSYIPVTTQSVILIRQHHHNSSHSSSVLLYQLHLHLHHKQRYLLLLLFIRFAGRLRHVSLGNNNPVSTISIVSVISYNIRLFCIIFTQMLATQHHTTALHDTSSK